MAENNLANARRRPLDTPLCNLVQRKWPQFDSGLSDMEIEDEDILRFVFWTIDCMKDCDVDIDLFCDNMWNKVYKLVRADMIGSNVEDLTVVTNTVCAFCIYAFGLLVRESSVHRQRYMRIFRAMGDRRSDVEKRLLSIERGEPILSDKQWMKEYMDSPVFFTYSDAPLWDNGEIKRGKG